MQADSTTHRRHSSQPPPTGNNGACAPQGLAHNRSKLRSNPNRRSSSVDRFPNMQTSVVQAMTGSSDAPLSSSSGRYGAFASAGPTQSPSRGDSIHKQTSTCAQPHAQLQYTRPGISAMPASEYEPANAAYPSSQSGSPLHLPVATCSSGDRYSLAGCVPHREAQLPMQEQPPGRYLSTRLRSEERVHMQCSHRPATAQPDLFSNGYRHSGAVGSLSRDGSPARLQGSRGDKPFMSSPAAHSSPMARLANTGEMRNYSSDVCTLRRPAMVSGTCSPDAISAGLEPAGRMLSPVPRAPSLTGRKLCFSLQVAELISRVYLLRQLYEHSGEERCLTCSLMPLGRHFCSLECGW